MRATGSGELENGGQSINWLGAEFVRPARATSCRWAGCDEFELMFPTATDVTVGRPSRIESESESESEFEFELQFALQFGCPPGSGSSFSSQIGRPSSATRSETSPVEAAQSVHFEAAFAPLNSPAAKWSAADLAQLDPSAGEFKRPLV